MGITCWALFNATIFALTATRFKRRTIYLICTISLLVIFTAWTIASARYSISGDQASSRAVIAPCYNIAYNALTYSTHSIAILCDSRLYVWISTAFLVELFPFKVRAKGISVFQWFSRAAGFFNALVNPIGISNAGWKYYISYCIFLLFEVGFVYFLFPETYGRTLEELAFLYEDDKVVEQKRRVEEEIHHDEKVDDAHDASEE
ncbi:hypothetical protein H0H87_012808 [Tephrocybe sp. NHM501043]|nr:hypothetical protein H0H87_012808 [Tephrocybe sp. NHM501043]